MIRLLFIVPYPELEKTIRYILENHPEKGRISADVLVRSVDEVERLSVTSYDAAIARGYSARLLRSAFPDTPVVDMVISGYDIMRTVMECKNAYGAKRIAVCGFSGRSMRRRRSAGNLAVRWSCIRRTPTGNWKRMWRRQKGTGAMP